MLTADQARRLSDGAPDIAELIRAFNEVELFYREAVAAMSLTEADVKPVVNSAQITVSFPSMDVVKFD